MIMDKVDRDALFYWTMHLHRNGATAVDRVVLVDEYTDRSGPYETCLMRREDLDRVCERVRYGTAEAPLISNGGVGFHYHEVIEDGRPVYGILRRA